MKTFLIKELAAPILRRVGTMVAAYLVASGVGEDMVTQIVTGMSSAALVAVDLLLSSRSRK